MSCELAIIGVHLKTKELLEMIDIQGFKEFLKGLEVSKVNMKKRKYSYISISTSMASFDDLKTQISETESFLMENFDKLKVIKETEGVDYAVLNFGVNFYIDEKRLAQSFYLPIEIIKLCSELQFEIEVSVYADNMDEVLSKRYGNSKPSES